MPLLWKKTTKQEVQTPKEEDYSQTVNLRPGKKVLTENDSNKSERHKTIVTKKTTNTGFSGLFSNFGFSFNGLFNFDRGERVKKSPVETIGDLKTYAKQTPLSFLEDMTSNHPTLSLALENAKRSMFFQDAVRYEVRKNGIKDDLLTEEIREFLKRQSKEINSYEKLHEILTTELYVTGLLVAETTTNPTDGATEDEYVFRGLNRLYLVPSKTVVFERADGDILLPKQYQDSEYGTSKDDVFTSKKQSENDFENLHDLPIDNTFWTTIGSTISNPHGTGVFSTAVNEIIADYALVRDLRDAVRNGAWPRLNFDFDFNESFKVAKEVFQIDDPDEAQEFVLARYNDAVNAAENVAPDGNIIGKVNPLPAGDFQALDSVLTFLRQRLAQACKTLPSLLGIQEGTASSYSSIEWGIYVSVLESIRHIICSFVAEIFEHHLFWLGYNLKEYKVVPVYKKIRTNEELAEQNILEVKIRNYAGMVALGWLTNEEACMSVLGTKPSGSPIPNILENMFGKVSTPDANQSKQKPGAGNKNENKTGG
jgi:hypothetical protein